MITFLGDVWLTEPVQSKVQLAGPYVFNLEAPITRRGRPASGKINMRSESAFFLETFGRQPVAVCLANNHIADYGPEGLQDTLAALDAAGVKYFGAGTLADNGHNPLVLDVDGRRLGLVGYACPTTHAVFARGDEPGAMPLELSRIAGDIELARRRGAEHVVVQLHWGQEHVHWPKPEDVAKARKLVDLGADAVIGHHAHCIQACELYKGKPIFYGLGNAIFPERTVPSYCGADGAPSRLFTGPQRYWNRRSLLVEYDTGSGSANVRPLAFDGAALTGSRSAKTPPFVPDLGVPGYERRYSRKRAYSALRGALADFLREPKLPRFSHFQRLYTVMVKHG